MAKKYAIWDKTSNVYTPSGAMFTPEQWIDKFKWINAPGMVPIVSGGSFNGSYCGELNNMKDRYARIGCEFNDSMSDQEIIDTINDFEDARDAEAIEAAKMSADTPTDTERIAAALEYQNLLSM